MTCTSRSITAFVLMCLAALFWVIGVSTDSMASISSGGVKIVYGRLFPKHNQDTLPDWQKASQSMAIIGLIALVAAAVVSLLTLCCKNCGRRLILILQTVALFGSATCITLCVIIYGAKLTEIWKPFTVNFGYSYALICVSAGFAAIAGIVSFMDMVKDD